MPDNTAYNERELLSRIAGKDEKAFSVLYNQYSNFLKEFAIRYLKSNQLADDAVQEVFLKVWQMGASLTEINSIRSYLTVTVRNHVLNILKRAASLNAGRAEILRHYDTIPEDPGNDLYWKEYQRYITEVLRTLPARTVTIFQLIREEEKSYEEVAELLGISRNVVKKHVMKSNEAFRNALKKDGSLAILIYLQYLTI